MSLNSGHLILRRKGGPECVFGRSHMDDFSTTLPWHLAELIVDTAHLYEVENGIANRYFNAPGHQGRWPAVLFADLAAGHTCPCTDGQRHTCRCTDGITKTLHVYFDPRRIPDPKNTEDAELMQSVRAEALRKERVRDRWWRGRALALALGTQERIGERSPIRMLDSDALRAILASVRAAGPASEAEYHADCPGRPSYSLDPGKWSDGAASAAEGGGSAAPAVGSRPNRRKAAGLCRIHSGVCSLF